MAAAQKISQSQDDDFVPVDNAFGDNGRAKMPAKEYDDGSGLVNEDGDANEEERLEDVGDTSSEDEDACPRHRRASAGNKSTYKTISTPKSNLTSGETCAFMQGSGGTAKGIKQTPTGQAATATPPLAFPPGLVALMGVGGAQAQP